MTEWTGPWRAPAAPAGTRVSRARSSTVIASMDDPFLRRFQRARLAPFPSEREGRLASRLDPQRFRLLAIGTGLAVAYVVR